MPKNLARSVVLQETDMLESVIIIVHLVMALALVGLVLIQQGKGAEAGASFGSGASATVFGAQGTGSFFSRMTAILAAVFFVTSLALAFYAKERSMGVDDLGLPSIQVQQAQKTEVARPAQGDIPQLEEVRAAEGSDLQVGEQAGGDIPQAD